MQKAVRLLFLCLLAPALASAQSVDEVFDRMAAQELKNNGSVDDYLLETETLGMTTVEYYEKANSIDLDLDGDGETESYPVMRNVPLDEITERQAGNEGIANMSPGELEQAADAAEQAGRMMEAGLRDELASSGMGAGPGGLFSMLMSGPPPNPDGSRDIWLSANPSDMGSMYGTMLRAAARRKVERMNENPAGDAMRQMTEMDQMKEMARIVDCGPSAAGTICLRADDVNITQEQDGVTSTIRNMQLQLDGERYVPLAMMVDATILQDGEPRDITIERIASDYRSPAGCGDMYRPFSTVMRMKGLMTPEQEKEMQEAQAQLAELEEQLKTMPENQKKMMMQMVGPQLEMARSMAAGNGMEISSRVVNITCNAGLPDLEVFARKMMPGAGAN
jgi:hypothetical protein